MARAVTVSAIIALMVVFLTACVGRQQSQPENATTQGVEKMTYREILPDELRERLQSANPPVVVDVREPNETAQGHIKGAKLIPLGQLAGHLNELDPLTELVMVCRSGNRSSQAARALVANGYTKVYNLTGGMMGWRYETEK